MLSSLFYFLILIISINAYFDADYANLNLSNPSYQQYDGFYFKTGSLIFCDDGAPVNYDGTYVYKLEQQNVYLYEEGTEMNKGNPTWYTRLVLTTTTPCANLTADEYLFITTINWNHGSAWEDTDEYDPAEPDITWYSPPPDLIPTNITICRNSEAGCKTSAPSKSPTYEPTFEPTMEPTIDPTMEPTAIPTKTPTAPQVKYLLQQTLQTPICGGCNSFTLKIGLFIWNDPKGPSYARIGLTGPNDRSFMVFFTTTKIDLQGSTAYDATASVWLGAFQNTSSGFVVNPSASPNPTAGEIYIDRDWQGPWDYQDFSGYTQNSTILTYDTDFNAMGDTTFIEFKRTLTTTDPQDWQFGFTQLLDEFYICFIIADKADGFGDTTDKDCVAINVEGYISGFEDIKGNYGLRTKFESDPNHPLSPPPFTIFFQYDPFLFSYSGYVIKPKNTWLLWGDYYETNETNALETNKYWHYSTYCDIYNQTKKAEFTNLVNLAGPKRLVLGVPAQSGVWDIGEDDMGTNHRINFSMARTQTGSFDTFDMGVRSTGWDTVKFFTTREMTFNIFYGDSGAKMTVDQTAQADKYYGAVSVFLDYVTYAPTLAPSNAPSLAPSLAPTTPPSNAPSLAPSLAPTQPPSTAPSNAPSLAPSNAPSYSPSNDPSNNPSVAPSTPPSNAPSSAPTQPPSAAPTNTIYMCQSFCFNLAINTSDVEIAWLSAVNAVTTLNDFTNRDSMCGEIDSATLDNTVDTASTCFDCCASTAGLNEHNRWVLLREINEDIIEYRKNLGNELEQGNPKLIQAITYAEADHPYTSYKCNHIPYPRVCNTELLSDYTISIGLEANTTTAIFQMCFADGSKYFAIGFGETAMKGPGNVYTTGLQDTDNANIYAYTFTATGVGGVKKDTTQDIVNSMTSMDNGVFCVDYEREFDAIGVDGTEQSLAVFYAIGSNLKLEKHTLAATQILTMVPSPGATDIFWCDGALNKCTITDFLDTDIDTEGDIENCGPTKKKSNPPIVIDDLFSMAFEINCETEMVTMDVTYLNFKNGWFGFVFSQTMIGDAVVYTTGKQGKNREAALYAYDNTGKAPDATQVIYQPQKNWENVQTTRRRLQNGDFELNIIYTTTLANAGLTEQDDVIGFRWARGGADSMELAYHTSRSDNYAVINLETGAVTVTEDDKTLRTVHGIIMVTAWSVLCSIAIISSAARYIFNANPPDMWFKVHKTVQIICILLDLAGFGLAVYFTQDSGNPHFNALHQQLGLAVTIISVFQPLNALIRPHPAEKGQKKPIARVVWEIVHKLFGYGGWILSQYVVYLGIGLLVGDDSIYRPGHLIWCGLVLIVYFVLWIVKCVKVGATDPGTEEMMKVGDKSIEMGSGFSTSAQVTKQPTFVEEEDAPITKTISGK